MSDTSPGNASPILLFDGVCNLCHGFVRWVLAWDRRNTFRFASLQSVAARSALESAGVSPGSLPDSVVLLLPGEPPRVKSDAVLGVARILGFPWSLAGVGRVLPRTFRDRLYDWVAVHRYRWFGRRDTCLVPTPALRGQFLDADEIPKSP